MNKKWLGLLLLAMVMACTSNDEPQQGSNDKEKVRIEIGTKAPSLITKAAVEADNWEGTEVAVMGLSKTADTWNLNDHTSLFVGGVVSGIVGAEGAIAFTDGKHYYPDGDNAYTFYGYYPNEAAVLADNAVTVSYTLTGKEDILYGKSVAEDVNEKAGYNAAYFREEGATAPTIHFEHKLTRFTFEVKAGNEETVSEENQVQITSVRLLGVKNKVALNVANKADGTADGTLTATDETGDFVLADATGEPVAAVTATVYDLLADGTKIGESIMAMVETSYQVEITIKKVLDGTTETVIRTIALSDGAAFAAGSSYRVKLTVFGFTEVKVSASLEEWAQGEEIELPTIH